jgi:CheY-like chemotaxis protein
MRKKILVVDDEAVIADTLATILRAAGYEAIACEFVIDTEKHWFGHGRISGRGVTAAARFWLSATARLSGVWRRPAVPGVAQRQRAQ